MEKLKTLAYTDCVRTDHRNDSAWCECGAYLGKEGSYPRCCPECGLYTDGCPVCDDYMLPVPGQDDWHECINCAHREFVQPCDPELYEMNLAMEGE